jgi:hypothetical protein
MSGDTGLYPPPPYTFMAPTRTTLPLLLNDQSVHTVEPRLSEIKGADPISDKQNFG